MVDKMSEVMFYCDIVLLIDFAFHIVMSGFVCLICHMNLLAWTDVWLTGLVIDVH